MRIPKLALLLLTLSFMALMGPAESTRAAEATIANNPADAEATFTAATDTFISTNIGNPSVAGTVTAVSGGYNITAGGTNITGSSDQFTFNSELVAGDFDYKIRLAGMTLVDAWSKAGLMARETLFPSSTYACSFATPSVTGAYFQWRTNASGTTFNSGSFPVNYPNTWLRLRRAGNVFTGYASLDGDSWFQLGSATITMANSAYLGMAVSASVTNGSAISTVTAQFRDFAPATGGTIGTMLPEIEPPGPSSRKTPFALTEIMYRPFPATNASGSSLEFVEIYNSNPFFEEISRFRLSGDIDYTFPQGTFVQGGQYIVVAKDPAALNAYYQLSGVPVFGPYTNSLDRSGTVRLRNNSDGIVLEVPYSNDPPWLAAADGTGHSLVLKRPSYGEGFARAWGPSDQIGGSPGRADGYTFTPRHNVVINEFLANSTSPDLDYVELYNHSNVPVDLTGCALSDDPTTNKFIIATPTTIPPRGFVVYDQNQLGFCLSAAGETLYFRAPGNVVLDAVKFADQAEGVSSGRFPDGAREFYPLSARTPGAPNGDILIRDVVINEIMYKPLSGMGDDEYVELYNKGTNPVSLARWKFTSGINYTFPSNAVIAPGSYLVVAKNASRLLTNYPNLNSTNTYGDFTGKVRGGERLALAKPELNIGVNCLGMLETNLLHVVVDEVTLNTGGNWGNWANEGGSSLELVDPRSDHRLAHNWADSDETQKAPWTAIECTGNLDNGIEASSFLEGYLMGEGECLLDNVEIFTPTVPNGCTNGTFEGGQSSWVMRGDHIRSTIDNTGGYPSGGTCLHIRGTQRGDSIDNRIRVPIAFSATTGPCTIRYKVRWLRGWPELLLRTHGNWMDCVGRMTVPANLGTPGARNSRAATNAPPAIYAVTHFPILPAANQNVTVLARCYDPDGVASLVARYRVDPATSSAAVPLLDDGTGGDAVAGDGIYSGTIPGQAAGKLVAFQVVAVDPLGATNIFPLQIPSYPAYQTWECLVRFGEPTPASAFGVYRQWLPAALVSEWASRPALSNEKLYGTFVYGNFRVVYNHQTRYNGSPYHQGLGSPETGLNHFTIGLPDDDVILGTPNFNKIHSPGNGPYDDVTLQREQICYWTARQMGLPWGNRRFVNMYVNGNRKTRTSGSVDGMMEDSQTPGSDMLEEFFNNDQDGHLYKLQPWFETDDGTGQTIGFRNQGWCSLLRYTTPSNGVPVQKTARYRNNYLVRAVNGTANDYSTVFQLIDAANSPAGPALTANFSAVVDLEEWFRIFAVEHASGNWDAFGCQNSQNMYGYKPDNSKWRLMIWDWNIVLGNSGSWGAGQNLFLVNPGIGASGPDTTMMALYNNPPFRRTYWRAMKELCNGPWRAGNVEPVLDAKFKAMRDSGVNAQDPGSAGVKNFIAAARSSILTQLATEDAAAFKITVPDEITTNNNLISITGEAPVEAKSIRINGIEYPITWTSVKAFRVLVAAGSATNELSIQADDANGNALAGFATNITVHYTGSFTAPESALVINEIMYNPLVPEASYIEIYNHSDFSFDVSGWRVNGLDFTFPDGSLLTNRQYLVLAKNLAAFSSAYGSSVAPAGAFEGNLDRGGETLTLERPMTVLTTNNPFVTTNTIYIPVDKVRYDDGPPWPPAADGFGPALQLIDANQDNGRVSNWTDHEEWRYYSFTGTISGGTTLGTNFLLFLNTPGDVYLDDLVLVAGTQAGQGPNLLENGDFESTFAGPWVALGSHSNSVISTEFSHSGSASLHIISTGNGAPTSTIRQFIPALPTNTVCTVSFWFRPSTNGNILTARTTPGSTFVSTNGIRPTFFTPGAANSVAAPAAPYDPLWLNELQPNNVTGPVDNHQEHDPWIELFNAGTNTLDLSGYYLADNYTTNLTQWPFPPGSSLAPGAFKLVWADGQPAQSIAAEWHANFRLNSQTGSVALVRLVLGKPQITDYLNYSGIGPDLSYGDFPNGQPISRQTFFGVTPGASNVAREVTLFINEWMASNTNFLADPADGHFDDWFELYNPGTNAVDLGGYWLTDNVGSPQGFQIPANGQYVLPPGGFLLVWADNETNENTAGQTDLHVNFQLSKSGEQIGLFAPNGFTEIDSVTFGPQTNDISQGRFADGAGSIYFMTTPTPRGPNTLGLGNTPPTVNPIGNRSLTLGQTLSFTVTATDPDRPAQSLSFVLAPGFPGGASINATSGLFSWTPSETQAPSTNSFTVRVTDNGVPPASGTGSFTVIVGAPPKARITIDGHGGVSLVFGTLAQKSYRIDYKESLSAPSWTPLGPAVVANGDSLTVPDNLSGHPQRFYRIVQVD